MFSMIDIDLKARGFARARNIRGGSGNFFIRPRGDWVDALAIDGNPGVGVYDVSFGLEYNLARRQCIDAVGSIIENLAPATKNVFEILILRPCLTMFHVPGLFRPYAVPVEALQPQVFDNLDATYFSISSEDSYLTFLSLDSGVFDWRKSASLFRLIYLAILFKLRGHSRSSFELVAARIPISSIEAHSVLISSGIKGPDFIGYCLDIVWKNGGIH
jgi:hypothetical protein